MFHTVSFGLLAATILVLSLPVSATVINFESFLDGIYTVIYATANSLHEFEYAPKSGVTSSDFSEHKGGTLTDAKTNILEGFHMSTSTQGEVPTRDQEPSTSGKLVKRESDSWDLTPNMRQTGRRSTEAAV